jgi:hypothetical protein
VTFLNVILWVFMALCPVFWQQNFESTNSLTSAFADYASNVNSGACLTDQYWAGQNADFNGTLTLCETYAS